jgi:hypothetical protein
MEKGTNATSQPFRVVVTKAREASVRKEFIWQIVHEDEGGHRAVRAVSQRSFKTMEEAYRDGAAVLANHAKLPEMHYLRAQPRAEVTDRSARALPPAMYTGWYSDDAQRGPRPH